MGIEDLVAFLGDRHVDRADLPPELEPYVDDGLDRGKVLEDCRNHLAALT